MGSSPRAWGRQTGARCLVRRRGLISACAGPTRPRATRPFRLGAHLRVRGADQLSDPKRPHPQGSSLRARGRHRLEWLRPVVVGLISACAGPTEHPPHSSQRAVGSSPRARCRHRHGDSHRPIHGLISACAGPILAGCCVSALFSWWGKRLPSLSLPRGGR